MSKVQFKFSVKKCGKLNLKQKCKKCGKIEIEQMSKSAGNSTIVKKCRNSNNVKNAGNKNPTNVKKVREKFKFKLTNIRISNISVPCYFERKNLNYIYVCMVTK